MRDLRTLKIDWILVAAEASRLFLIRDSCAEKPPVILHRVRATATLSRCAARRFKHARTAR